jgi:hypothetical protein
MLPHDRLAVVSNATASPAEATTAHECYRSEPGVERGATTHVVAQALGHESETTSRESYISREAITGADQRRVLGVLAGTSRRSRSPRNNRALTPRRGNDSPDFITAEPCVTKNSKKIVEMNGIEPSAS